MGSGFGLRAGRDEELGFVLQVALVVELQNSEYSEFCCVLPIRRRGGAWWPWGRGGLALVRERRSVLIGGGVAPGWGDWWLACVEGERVALSGGRLCLRLSRVPPLGGWGPVAGARVALCFAGRLSRWCLLPPAVMVIVAVWGRCRHCGVSTALGRV